MLYPEADLTEISNLIFNLFMVSSDLNSKFLIKLMPIVFNISIAIFCPEKNELKNTVYHKFIII